MRDKILVTGGTGYIGSHTCVALLQGGFEPIVVDNLSRSHASVLDRIARISGYRPIFYQADVRDATVVDRVFREHVIASVVHIAGLKSVGDSVRAPLAYYANNVAGSLALLGAMARAGVKRFIFSSSATVYGTPDAVPVSETAPLRPTTPYGRTKAAVEDILRDMCAADPSWQIGVLRYFNPVGAHESGLIGENPRGVPENLMPLVAQAAAGQKNTLHVFGNDYPTPDGTGIRDYIHVVDLAEGHLSALAHLNRSPGLFTVNLGTGKGHTVLEVIEAFRKISARDIPYKIVGRRPGDVAASYADVNKAREVLGWRSKRDLATMCADAWRWQQSISEIGAVHR
jgi:UDP-glucose 4-epimerase